MLPPLPPLHVILMGGVASGKGTIAPMLSQAFKSRVVGVGQLLRGEMRAGRGRGLLAAEKMAAGELLDDQLVLELLLERLSSSHDLAHNGWLIDGFPRTAGQATAILADEWAPLRPDAVVLIERPDELVKEFSMGRCMDSTTGQTYHPTYAPAPREVHERLVFRLDDTLEVLERRIAEHHVTCDQIVSAFETAGVPLCRFDNAQSELQTYDQIASFLEGVASNKLLRTSDRMLRELRGVDAAAGWGDASSHYQAGYGGYGGPRFQSGLLTSATQMLPEAVALLSGGEADEREGDIAEFCTMDEEEGSCIQRYQQEQELCAVDTDECEGTLLAAVRRCNQYELGDFLPVLVGKEQVGWVNEAMLDALTPQLAVTDGCTCELVYLEKAGRLASVAARRAMAAIRLAPEATSVAARTSVMAEMVNELVLDGMIPAAKVRDELQDVYPLSAGFVADGDRMPLVRLERAAMIYFGVPSYGVHVNGWVRNPQQPHDPRPWAMWVAKRSLAKATYAGMLDQMVAGGQPSGLSFADNVRKECEEEASLPPEVLATVRQSGLISYRYATTKGLSTKVLATYDVELPTALFPMCADGEVDEFRLMPIDEVLDSIRNELPLWKPNSAMVALDFAIRHGFVDFDEPGYMEICHLLRAGGFG